jgi:hypothetical protein
MGGFWPSCFAGPSTEIDPLVYFSQSGDLESLIVEWQHRRCMYTFTGDHIETVSSCSLAPAGLAFDVASDTLTDIN